MSYTLTLDVPQGAEAFVARQGRRFWSEMNALFVAVLTTRMRFEQDNAVQNAETPRQTGLDLFKSLRERAPLLDDEQSSAFDRIVDYGREVDLS